MTLEGGEGGAGGGVLFELFFVADLQGCRRALGEGLLSWLMFLVVVVLLSMLVVRVWYG